MQSKLTLFTVNKDERDKKEGTGKLHWTYCSMPKSFSRAKGMSNNEKVCIPKLCCISQSGS